MRLGIIKLTWWFGLLLSTFVFKNAMQDQAQRSRGRIALLQLVIRAWLCQGSAQGIKSVKVVIDESKISKYTYMSHGMISVEYA